MADAPPAARFTAAGQIAPQNDEERDLCERGSSPDYLYLGGLLALDVAAIAVHPTLKQDDHQIVRTLGSGFIGLSWGATLGGAPLTLPTCDRTWVYGPPPEGDIRARWPFALALSLAAATTAPIIVGITTGPLPSQWTYGERSSRLWIAAGTGAIGSLLPYVPVLSPRTWRAGKELERLRFAPIEGGAYGVYTVAF